MALPEDYWRPGSCGAWPRPEAPEASLAEHPLAFLWEYGAAAAWRTVLWDEARRCFAFHRPRALRPETTHWLFERLRACVPWQELRNKAGKRVSRHTAWYTRDRACRCEYTYGMDTRVAGSGSSGGNEFRQLMEELFASVFGGAFPRLAREAWPDCANLNLYSDGNQGVGWHADDELLFQATLQDCPIVSLSLGGMREFWLALKADNAPDVRQGVVELDLRDGDLFTMEGLTQKHCTHLVPIASRWDHQRQQPRINVTFRWLRVHKLRCPVAGCARLAQMPKCARALGREARQPPAEQVQSSEAAAASAGKGAGLPHDRTADAGSAEEDEKSSGAQHGWRADAETRGPRMSPHELAEDRSRWLAVASAEGAIVPSLLVEAARPLFGMGPKNLRIAPPPRPGGSAAHRGDWPFDCKAMASSLLKWQACDACGHACWGGGRACKEGQDAWFGQFFCRCCWHVWAEV